MSRWKKLSNDIQMFGRSLLLPIAVMAPVGMILGISGAFAQGYMIERLPFLGIPAIKATIIGLRTIASIIFNNIPLLFAMGVAYGMSKKEKGIAAFSSVLAYLVLLTTINVWLTIAGQLAVKDPEQYGQTVVLGIQTLRIDALGGIIAGLTAAFCTDRFFNLQLPAALAFFGGKKSVPIISMSCMVVIGAILPFLWQFLTMAMVAFSTIILDKIYGTFLFLFMNRLLIPLGLHHVWDALVRFTPAGGMYDIDGKTYVGIIPAMNYILFQAGPDKPAWALLPNFTRFEAQVQMVNTLFIMPAICLALYKSALPQNRTFVKGLVVTMALTAMLGNVTEPVEFSFLFIAPLLFLFHAIMLGVCGVLLYLMGTAVGYIRGTVFDFVIFGLLYKNTQWWNIIIVGVGAFITYYSVFRWAIKRWNIPTLGREDEEQPDNNLLAEKNYLAIAEIVVTALGGKYNIVHVENCITRLRIDLKDATKIDNVLLKQSGTRGMFLPSKNHIHIVFGPQVEFIRNAVDELVR